jgi:hypothetical protein
MSGRKLGFSALLWLQWSLHQLAVTNVHLVNPSVQKLLVTAVAEFKCLLCQTVRHLTYIISFSSQQPWNCSDVSILQKRTLKVRIGQELNQHQRATKRRSWHSKWKVNRAKLLAALLNSCIFYNFWIYEEHISYFRGQKLQNVKHYKVLRNGNNVLSKDI